MPASNGNVAVQGYSCDGPRSVAGYGIRHFGLWWGCACGLRIGWAAIGIALLRIGVWDFDQSRVNGSRCVGAAVPTVLHDATRSWDRRLR
jgi:hypothetical protein